MNLQKLLEDLRAQRTGLEWEYAGRRSQLDNVIWRMERELAGDGSAEPRPTGGEPSAIAPAPAPRPEPKPEAPKPKQPKPSQNGKGVPKPKGANGGARAGSGSPRGGVALAVRQWVSQQSDAEEFSRNECIRAHGNRHSAVSCALLDMVAAGEIERVRYGWYRRTGKCPSSVAKDYAKLRAEMGDLTVPDVQTAVGRGEE